MEVILLEDVPGKGSIGDTVNVRAGFARNKLIPNNMALIADASNKRQLEHQKRLVGFKRARARAAAEQSLKALDGLILTIRRKAGEQDKLYGSVTPQDVSDALKLRGIDIDRRRIDLPESVRKLGTYDVGVRVVADLQTTIQLSVVPEPT